MTNVKKLFLCVLLLCAALLSSCAVEECDSYVSMTDAITETDPATEMPTDSDSVTETVPESWSDEETRTPPSVETETETASPTESETEFETESTQMPDIESDPSEEVSVTDGEEPEKDPLPPAPDEVLSSLRDSNRIPELLTNSTAVLINASMQNGETQVFSYAWDKEELLIDWQLLDFDAAVSASYTVRDGAYYGMDAEALSFSVLPDYDLSYLCELFSVDLFPDELLADRCVLGAGELQLSAHLVSAELKETERIEYVYCIDAPTMRLKTLDVSFYAFGRKIGHERFSLDVKSDAYSPDMLAYYAHTEAEDALRLHAQIKPQSGGETRIYTVSASSSVGAYPTKDGTAFAVYKNAACTKDIKDLSFATGTEVSVYVSEWEGELSLSFNLTEEDLFVFCEAVDTFESLAIEGKSAARVIEAYYELEALYEYIDSQSVAAYVQYYSDLSSESGQENFMLAQSIASDARVRLNEAYAEILDSGSPMCTLLFAGWSDEQLAALSVDRAAISVLEEKNAALLTEYNALVQDDAWGDVVNRIYADFVSNNNEIAILSGYENYYAYATHGYNRDYGEEEREAFRAYVKTYVIPLYEKTLNRFYEISSGLNLSQREWINALTVQPYTAHSVVKRYVDGYIDSFTPALAENMSSMFEKDVMVIGTANGAYQGAFTTYLSLYEEPIAYFASGSMDALTVIHENGHYAAFCSLGSSNLPGLDLCETHSQGNEWLFISYLGDRLDPAVHEALTLVRLLNGLNVVIYATVVDECEELIYTANTPYSAEEYDTLIDSVIASYGSYVQESFPNLRNYFKMVAVNSPVYYLSYATSELASMSLYQIAEEDFETAIGAYTALVETVTPDSRFLASLNAAGILSPFEEETFVKLTEVFEAYLGVLEETFSTAA